ETWVIETGWWKDDGHVSRSYWRVRAEGRVFDLRYDRLTKAWALYRGGDPAGAATAFREFATRYPQLPARDEARLMAGQILLESGKSDSAEKYFQGIADSISGELGALQARPPSAMTDASRAFVTTRVAGSVFIANAAPGKVISLPDDAGAEKSRIAAAFNGTPDVGIVTESPQIQSNVGLAERVDSAAGTGFPVRVVFAPRTGAQTPGAYADRTQAVLAADVHLALASFRLQEQIDAQQTKIAALENLQRLIVEGDSGLADNAKQIASTQDSLERMKGVLAQTREKVRNTLRTQITATRQVAAENIRLLDSTKASIGATAKGPELDALTMEQQTAGIYSAIADDIERGLDAALDHHPAFALRDSLVVRLVRAHALHDTTAAVLSEDSLLVANELVTQRGKESNAVLAMRTQVGTATSQRAAAEGALVALVDEELRARDGTRRPAVARPGGRGIRHRERGVLQGDGCVGERTRRGNARENEHGARWRLHSSAALAMHSHRFLIPLVALTLAATAAARAQTAPAPQLVASARPGASDDARDEAIDKLSSFLARYPT
ncbi:MAG: hypothetical protein JJD97_14415, partial [Gemmatimonadaceae bacterium]|nr:hypothetical protein [Gemmatimonadaceae bacterium]